MEAWGLLLTSIASIAVHMEIVISLALKDFLIAFSRFNHVHGKVDVVYSDNGSTFQAASKTIPDLFKSPDLKTLFEKKESGMNLSIATILIRAETGRKWSSSSNAYSKEP